MEAAEARKHFVFDARLGIEVPNLMKDWDELTTEEQSEIIYYWEIIRGTIPDRIIHFEQEIVKLQAQLDNEEDFEIVCKLTWDIADRASRINDLNLYSRINQDVAVKAHY